MFEPPDTKTIRRSDLASSSSGSATSSRSASPATYARQQSQLASLFSGPIFTVDSPLQEVNDAPHDTASSEAVAAIEDAHAFRLFSSTTSTVRDAIPVIRLASPSLGPGAILHARPRQHYFHTPASSASRSTYARAAVSGAAIRRLSHRTSWPGAALPWRVQRVQISRKAARKLDAAPPAHVGHCRAAPGATGPAPPGQATAAKRAKAGKKRRVVLRERIRTAQAAEAQRARDTEEQQAAERLKRARRNREKKAKRVAREKAKKASSSVAAPAGSGSAGAGMGALAVADARAGSRVEDEEGE